MTKQEAVFTHDKQNKTLKVVRSFDAPLEQVWKAWTKSEILDQWWAPKPWKAETKSMDFREGGAWVYCMVGPKGERSWCKENFEQIEIEKKITNNVIFCDENENHDVSFPTMYWNKGFSGGEGVTMVNVEIRFDSEADMDKIIGMRFREGFTAGLNNLDEVLSR